MSEIQKYKPRTWKVALGILLILASLRELNIELKDPDIPLASIIGASFGGLIGIYLIWDWKKNRYNN